MSIVSFEVFLSALAEDLEISYDDIAEIPLKDIPQYDSMGKIITSLTIEKLFGFQIPFDVLDKENSIESLYKYCSLKVKAN